MNRRSDCGNQYLDSIILYKVFSSRKHSVKAEKLTYYLSLQLKDKYLHDKTKSKSYRTFPKI